MKREILWLFAYLDKCSFIPVEAEDIREKIDIVRLNAEIKEIVAREQVFLSSFLCDKVQWKL